MYYPFQGKNEQAYLPTTTSIFFVAFRKRWEWESGRKSNGAGGAPADQTRRGAFTNPPIRADGSQFQTQTHYYYYSDDGVLSVRRRDPRQRMPSEVALNSPPPVSPPADADCPAEKAPPEPAPLPTPGKPAWCRVAFHTCKQRWRAAGGINYVQGAGERRRAERTRRERGGKK